MRFANKAYLVTGGGSGIGRAIVQRLVEDGARVWIIDVEAHAGRDAMLEYGEHVQFVRGSVASEPVVKKAVAAAVRWAGRLDGVVNNAGIADPHIAPIEKLPLAVWQRYLDTNLTGAFLVAKHAVPHLRKTRGSIINLGSTRALQSEPHTEAYAATKGGIVALTHALAVSLGPKVRVNCISPGWIEVGRSGELREADHAQHPVGRVGVPDDIAQLALFLLSERAGFITGQNFVVDGGMTRKMIYEP
jgi:NAD(P)-dependent dehydrogenase (short-subunit alcohol dehydrogenase family)